MSRHDWAKHQWAGRFGTCPDYVAPAMFPLGNTCQRCGRNDSTHRIARILDAREQLAER